MEQLKNKSVEAAENLRLSRGWPSIAMKIDGDPSPKPMLEVNAHLPTKYCNIHLKYGATFFEEIQHIPPRTWVASDIL